MITVGGYDDYNPIALERIDTHDFGDQEFSTKSRAENNGNMEKLMACVGH